MSGASTNEASIRTVSSTADSRISTGSARSVGIVGNSSANQQHVDYILVAQFSIDEGSIMEHQYPNPISGDEQ
jgi:hypothetical protein